MGSWCYSREWVWNLRTKLCCIASGKWNFSRVSLQELGIMYNVLGLLEWTRVSGGMLNKSDINTVGSRSFPGKGKHAFTFRFWHCEPFVKDQWGRNRGPNLVIFVFCSTLIIGGCVLVAWSRKYCLGTAKTASFVFPVLFKDGNAGWV